MITPVIRVFSGNVSQVETVLRASLEVAGQLDATLVLMHDVDFDPVDIAKVASLAFTTVRLVPQLRVPADLKWPSPQNLIWQQAARWADAIKETSLARSPGWLWWESDASPLVPNWLSTLSTAYKAGRKLFAGVPCHYGTETYMNGVGIYPFNIVDTLQDCSALYCRQLPFDIAAAPCVMRSFTDLSHLMVHVRKPRGGTMQRLTQPRLDSLRLKYPQAVFLHGHSGRSGDASGDLKSSVAPSTTPPPPTVPPITLQTKWPCGLFTFPPAPTLTAYFNPSLIRYNNKRWLFTRRQQFDGEPGSFEHNHSDLTIFELRDNNTLALPMLVPQVPNRYPFEQWEDPRAMVGSDGRVYTSHSTWVHYKPWSIRQALCRLSTDWTSLEVIQEPRYGGNTPLPSEGTRHEKNWTFFEHDSRWWFVYTINPHVVVPVAGKRTPEPYANSPLKLNWSHGEPRGGTPPVKVDSDYVCFFHSAVDWIAPKRRYYMGAYTFSARPPFNVTRITTEPLLVGSELDFRSLNGPPCVFPNGALLENGHWTVVFGVNDEGSGWIRIPHKDLLKRLSPV